MLIYEMVAGRPPFYDEDRVRMFKNICSVKYACPPTFSKVRAQSQHPVRASWLSSFCLTHALAPPGCAWHA